MKVIKELDEVEIATAIHPRRRVVVMLRDDGNFTFAEQYHYVTECDGEVIAEGWVTLPPEGIWASAAEAELAGRAAFGR